VQAEKKAEQKPIDTNAPIVVDVRTTEEFEDGAYRMPSISRWTN
jgi:rhodanese-related sulfurtransferase